jgi:hypothetical protein
MKYSLFSVVLLAAGRANSLAQSPATSRAKIRAVCPAARALQIRALTPQQQVHCCAQQADDRPLPGISRDQFIRNCLAH